jgi:hypothetical protein
MAGVVTSRISSLPALAASLAFWAWCALLSYPMIADRVDLADPEHAYVSSATTVICQALGLVLFMAIMFASHLGYLGSTIGRLNLPQRGIFVIIYLSFVLQMHDNEAAILIGIFYNALILMTALALSILWMLPPDELERCLSLASVILCLFGICAIAILGWPQGRNVGSIQPNLFAAPLLAGFILSQFRPGIVGIVVRILCLVMIALVSSRFALIGCVTAIVLHELTFNPLGRAKIPVILVSGILALALWPQIISILALDDSARDLSSGFSGRDEYWRSAFEAISAHPFGIGFKRAVGDESGHNGYLKTTLEFGVVGGGLIIFFIACSIVMAGIEAIVTPMKTPRLRRFACARFGGLAALTFGAFFQPQLLSLGDAFAMTLLFLLFRPGPVASPNPADGARGLEVRGHPAKPGRGTPLFRRQGSG